MTQIQTETAMMKTGAGGRVKSMVDTELEMQISMIQRGLDMMTLISTQEGIMKIAILEMSTETGGIVECRAYLKCKSHFLPLFVSLHHCKKNKYVYFCHSSC